MATRVQATGKSHVQATTFVTCSFGSLPTAGNLIVVHCITWNGNNNADWPWNGVTDNQGNVYQLAVKSAKGANGGRCAVYYAENIGTPSGTFTVTVWPDPHGGGSYIVAAAVEYSGMSGTLLLDKTATNSGSSTTPSTGTTAATTQATEVVAGVMAILAGQASITVGVVSPVFVEECEELSFAYMPGEGDDRIVTSTGTQSCSWTCATTGEWVACIATFKSTGTPAGPSGVPVTTFAGTLAPIKRGTLDIYEVANARNTLTCDVVSTGSYRPTVDSEVVVTLNGTRIFGGTIDKTTERGSGDVGLSNLFIRVNVNDFNSLADRRYIQTTLAAGTLKSMLTTLVTFLTTFGVTLDTAQVNGPSLSALTYDYKQITEILNDLAVLTGYVWAIDYDKKLSMYNPGTVAAPFDVTSANRMALNDIQVEQNARTSYANHIILRAGSNSIVEKSDNFTGNGVLTSFTLTYTPDVRADPYTAFYGYVTNNAVNETLGVGATWTFNAGTNQITRAAGAPANGNAINVKYVVQFPITVEANDTGGQATYGILDKLIEVPDIYDKVVAQAMADAALADSLERLTVVRYETRGTGLKPGQTQTINVTTRNVNASYLITDIRSHDDADGILRKYVTAVQGTTLRPTWQEVYKNWSGSGGSTAPVAP